MGDLQETSFRPIKIMHPFIIFVGLVFSLITIGCIRQRAREIRLWNKGISSYNGKPWQLFDHTSQGDRGYTDGENYIWISYKVDK